MSQLINDTGFVPNDITTPFVTLDHWTTGCALQLTSDTDPNDLDRILSAPCIRIEFPTSADGRGFTLARLLRLRGYKGHLRAFGHVIADQYAMARRSGFDDVEIHDTVARRQPHDQWLFRTDWQDHDYQSRLRGDRSPIQSAQNTL